MAEDVCGVPLHAWEQVCRTAMHALVVLDSRCMEALHWNGGAALLLDAGARGVARLRGARGHQRMVFVLSEPLAEQTGEEVKRVVCTGQVRCCVLFCGAAYVDADAWEETLRLWMGSACCAVEVRHTPALTLARVSPQLILTTAHADIFPPLLADWRSDTQQACGSEAQAHARSLAHAVNALLESSGVREDTFALGTLSRLIATELAGTTQAKVRRKGSNTKRASLIIVDRTLDLPGAVGHHGDCLVEKILAVLPQLEEHETDIQVDMLELTDLPATPENVRILSPGSMSQPRDSGAQALWEAMLSSRHKEAVMEVRRHLVEAASRENLPIKMSLGRVTAEQLSSYIKLFKMDWKALERNVGVLQLALATAQTLSHPHLARWDNCLATERLLLQALGDSGLNSVLTQLQSLVKSTCDGSTDTHTLDELLALLIYVYALTPEEAELQTEKDLIGSLTLAITQQPQLSPLLQHVTGCTDAAQLSEEKAHVAVARVFDMLRMLGHTRQHFKQLQSIYSGSDGVHQAAYRPFLKQLLEEIFHPDRPECTDVEHMSAGLTDLLKTGFSMFMKVNRPHPSDHSLLLLFLVGGVTPSELRLIREFVSTHKPGVQVVVLSTRLLKAADIPELLLR